MGIEILPQGPPIPEPLREALDMVDFATLGHFLETGVCNSAIRRLAGAKRVVGPAMTVRTVGSDSSLLHHAIGLVRPGDVVVVDTGGDDRHAPVGAAVTESLIIRGAAGVVVDGVCTDIDELNLLGLPVYGRGTTLLTTRLEATSHGGINQVIACGGVAVRPGDVALADANGVLFASRELLEELLPLAISEEGEERLLLEELRAGSALGHLTGATRIIEAAQAAQNMTQS